MLITDNCTITTKAGIKERFGTYRNAANVANKYLAENHKIPEWRVSYGNDELSPEAALFWSQVAFYEQHQVDLMPVADND